jgi:hypothetical protein
LSTHTRVESNLVDHLGSSNSSGSFPKLATNSRIADRSIHAPLLIHRKTIWEKDIGFILDFDFKQSYESKKNSKQKFVLRVLEMQCYNIVKTLQLKF